MTEEKRARIADVMRLIQEDCNADATALDGLPFTGRTVAEQFGNILASVQAIAKAVEVLVTEADPRPTPEGVSE